MGLLLASVKRKLDQGPMCGYSSSFKFATCGSFNNLLQTTKADQGPICGSSVVYLITDPCVGIHLHLS